jgi:hypothetical protein
LANELTAMAGGVSAAAFNTVRRVNILLGMHSSP